MTSLGTPRGVNNVYHMAYAHFLIHDDMEENDIAEFI